MQLPQLISAWRKWDLQFLRCCSALKTMYCLGALEIVEVTAIVVEVLEGLLQLHDANILHLDLKPANILLDSYGHAYLSDFGISYALRTLEHCTVLGCPAGTPHYM